MFSPAIVRTVHLVNLDTSGNRPAAALSASPIFKRFHCTVKILMVIAAILPTRHKNVNAGPSLYTEDGGSIDTVHYKLGAGDFKCED